MYSDKMKKILFVIETLRGGGAERALSNIVTHFPHEWSIDILINDKINLCFFKDSLCWF